MCCSGAATACVIPDISWVLRQACFCTAWFFDRKTGSALILSVNIDSSRTVLLRPGVEGAQTSPAPSPAPHTCCGWRPCLHQHQLEMSVWGAGKSEMHSAHTHTYTYVHTNTHSSLFHLQPWVLENLTGAAFLVRTRSHAKGLSNLSLDFYTHTNNQTSYKT